MSPLDTDDWKLSAHIMWKPKRIPNRSPCTYCSGRGQIGGGFKSIDGPEDCPRCFGTGKGEEINPLAPQPPLPPGLVDHMRKAWLEFFARTGLSADQQEQSRGGEPVHCHAALMGGDKCAHFCGATQCNAGVGEVPRG